MDRVQLHRALKGLFSNKKAEENSRAIIDDLLTSVSIDQVEECLDCYESLLSSAKKFFPGVPDAVIEAELVSSLNARYLSKYGTRPFWYTIWLIRKAYS